MNLNKKSLKVFLTIFIIFAFYIHWTGYTENSFFDLTRAITNEGKLNINQYYNNTVDRSLYKGNYYSNKAPGTSLLATLPYSISSLVADSKDPPQKRSIRKRFGKDLTALPLNLPKHIALGMVLTLIMLPALFTVLTSFLIYRTSMLFLEKKKICYAFAVVYALASPAFAYATVWVGQATGTFFAFLSFYLILHTEKNDTEKDGRKKLLLAGVASGFSVVCLYPAALISILFFLYSLHRFKKKSLLLLLGIVVGVLPLLIYNFSIFGNPMKLTFSEPDPKTVPFGIEGEVHEKLSSNLKFIFPSEDFQEKYYSWPLIIPRLLFYPYRGLFFYYPILLLSIPGFFYLYRMERTKALMIFLIFSGVVVAFSGYFNWWGATFFGPRFLTVTVPFLFIPIIFLYRKFRDSGILKIVFIALFIASLSVNLLGLQQGEETILNGQSLREYSAKINSFKPIDNPLISHYLPLFLENGPRSKLFESLYFSPPNLDIRDPPYSRDVVRPTIKPKRLLLFTLPGIGFLTLSTPFFSLFVLSCIILLLWREKILMVVTEKLGDRNLSLIFIIVVVSLIFVSFLEVRGTAYGRGWYPSEEIKGSETHYMSQNSTLHIFNKGGEKGYLKLKMNSFKKARNLTLLLNGEMTLSKEIGVGYKTVNSKVTLRRGKNTLKLVSENCSYVASQGRCLSFNLMDMEFIPLANIDEEIVYGQNWCREEEVQNTTFRFMSNNATLKIYNQEKKPVKRLITFKAHSYEHPQELNIYVDGKKVFERKLGIGYKKYHTSLLTLQPGENTIRLESSEGCDVPPEGSRCLSFNFKKITQVNSTEVRGVAFFRRGWYEKEVVNGTELRFMKSNSTIEIFNPSRKTKTISLQLRLHSYNQSRTLLVQSPNKSFGRLKVGIGFENLTTDAITLRPGRKRINFVALRGCNISNETGRCLSFAFNSIKPLSGEDFYQRPFFREGWYPEEKLKGGTFRAMRGNSTIEYYLQEGGNYSISFRAHSFKERKTLNVYINGRKVSSREISIPFRNYEIENVGLQEGRNKIYFKAEEGCEYSEKAERCVSLFLDEISIEKDEDG